METKWTSDREHSCLSRREFFVTGGKALVTSVVVLSIPGIVDPIHAEVHSYPRKRVAGLADLKADEPVYFKIYAAYTQAENLTSLPVVWYDYTLKWGTVRLSNYIEKARGERYAG